MDVAQPQKTARERELEVSRKESKKKKEKSLQDDLKEELHVSYGAMLQFSHLGF